MNIEKEWSRRGSWLTNPKKKEKAAAMLSCKEEEEKKKQQQPRKEEEEEAAVETSHWSGLRKNIEVNVGILNRFGFGFVIGMDWAEILNEFVLKF